MLSHILKILVILIVCLSFSCSDENPTKTETGYGKVLIESNVENGEIFVDNKFAGFFTPDTLELLALEYNIKVRKEDYFSEERKVSFIKDQLKIENFELEINNLTKIVLIENFFTPDCDTCKFPQEKLNNLKKKFEHGIQIINYPSILANDNSTQLFDLKNDINQRLEFYNIIEPINFILDGKKSNNIDNGISNRLLDKTIFEIVIGDTIAIGDKLNLSVYVDVFDLDGYDFNNLFLISALIENDVQLSNSADSQNVDFVLRSFLNGSEGISLTGTDQKGRARFAFSELLNPIWKKDDLNIICFIQDRLSKEIIQVGSSKISLQ